MAKVDDNWKVPCQSLPDCWTLLINSRISEHWAYQGGVEKNLHQYGNSHKKIFVAVGAVFFSTPPCLPENYPKRGEFSWVTPDIRFSGIVSQAGKKFVLDDVVTLTQTHSPKPVCRLELSMFNDRFLVGETHGLCSSAQKQLKLCGLRSVIHSSWRRLEACIRSLV